MAVAVGLGCGILSGFGIGGGSLLMVWLTTALTMEQRSAQGINLLFFLPTALAALLLHARKGLVAWRSVIPAALAGCAAAGLGAWLAGTMNAGLLRKGFGGFLLFVGIRELLVKGEKKPGGGMGPPDNGKSGEGKMMNIPSNENEKPSTGRAPTEAAAVRQAARQSACQSDSHRQKAKTSVPDSKTQRGAPAAGAGQQAVDCSQALSGILNTPPSPTDPNGSYTGRPEAPDTVPVQDVDDL